MSLIDDALRRAQSARGGAASPSGPPDPWTTGPLPDPGRGRGRRLVLAAVIAVCAAGGLAAWLLVRRPAAAREAPPGAPEAEKEAPRVSSPLAASFPPRTPTPPPPIRAAAAAAPVPPPVRTEAASAIERGTAPGRERLVFSGTPTPAPRPPRPVPAVAAAPVPAMRSASAAPEIGWSPAPAPPPARSEREHAPPRPSPERRDTARGEIAVPGGKIELGGIVYSDTNPVAVLNGHVVGVGAYVEGFLVVAIEENRVELKNDQRTIVLTLR